MLSLFARNRFLVLAALLVFVLVVSCWLRSYNDQLLTHEAPYKIVSLQLSWTTASAAVILASWEGLMEIVVQSIYIDFLFIVSYTLFLLCCVVARNRGIEGYQEPLTKTTKVFLVVCLIAGACDAIENVFTLLYLQGQIESVVMISLPASIKFIAILAVVIYLIGAIRFHWEFIRQLMLALWLYIAGIIFVLIAYYLFIRVSAGRDVVIQIGEHSGPFLWTLFSVCFWAIVSWYSSRVVGYRKYRPDEVSSSDRNLIHLHIPRIIALNNIVCIQAAILALPTIGFLNQCQLWIFVVIHNLFYFVWYNLFTTSSHRRTHATITGVVFLAYALFVYHLTSSSTTHQRWLPLVALLLFVVELVLLWLFIRRRSVLQHEVTAAAVPVQIGSVISPVRLPLPEHSFFRKFNGFAALGIGVFVVSFFSLRLNDRMGALATAVLAFALLQGLSNMITLYSIHRRFNFFVLVFAWALILGNFYNPYKVRIHSNDTSLANKPRPDLKSYFENWLRLRSESISQSSEYPVYVVIADGGASRSGYWVSSVLSALEDESRLQKGEPFSQHVLCLSGASGGSVGTATFYSVIADKGNSKSCLTRSQDFLQEDFLSPVVTHWFGSDVVQHFVPLNFLGVGDRAEALEDVMEYFNEHDLDGTFSKPFREVVDQSGALPMLFINTTHVDQGAPAVVSNISLKEFSKRIDVLETLDENVDLRYSTAVVLGARFPYVSPAGAIDKSYYVDGGYFDNTGAGVVHEVLQKLDDIYRAGGFTSADSALYAKLEFRVIHLSNTSLVPPQEEDMHPLTNDIAAPLLTVLGTYSSQTDVNNQRLISFLRKLKPESPSVDFNINLYTKQNPQATSDSIDYPMNWVISDYNLNRMNVRLNNAKEEKEFSMILQSLK